MQKTSLERENDKSGAMPCVIMTTEDHGHFEVAERIAIISSQCVFGIGVLRDAFASVQATVNGRAKVVEATVQDGVEIVLSELKQQAIALGADAVIAVSVQYTPVGYGAPNMTLISGVGTAVRLAG
ncbi:heavy metal-binding domain-containing protein [Yoonia maricola]|nr:heavy metal-binding domain-containing protein [Yoonia maricola]